MRIIPSENDGFVLVLFDFALFDEPLFLRPDTLQQSLCRLVRWVLWYQLALDCLLQNRLFEGFWEGILQLLEGCCLKSVILNGLFRFLDTSYNSFLLGKRRDWKQYRSQLIS